MTTFDGDKLYELLPAIYRIRDAEQGQPLKQLLAVIGEQMSVIEENLDQLYADEFAETCAPWVLPYIADLIGIRGLTVSALGALSPRAEVAHTIGYRRRKGTASMLEQLARDVTGWPARAVEFFELIAATQYMNHLRPANQAFISLRGAERLADLDGPFERAATFGDPDLTHTVDVRRISRGHGRYNIPNVGIFLWRLQAMSLTRSPAVPDTPGDLQRFRFSPLGIDLPLFNLPVTENGFAHLAQRENVPDRIARRTLVRRLAGDYGRSFVLEEKDPGSTADPVAIDIARIVVCDLSTWTVPDLGKIAIDPVLGRIRFADDESKTLLVSFHYGFSASMGGGEYSRLRPADSADRPIRPVAQSISAALVNPPPNGMIVEIGDSRRYEETPVIDTTGNRKIELRAGDKHRPTIVMSTDLVISGDGEAVLDGLLVTGGAIHVTGNLRALRLRHCTLVPGISLAPDGTPLHTNSPSLVIASANTSVEIDRCILGGIVADRDAEVTIEGSIVDATDETFFAYAGETATKFGAPLKITNSTVIGRVRTAIMRLASNTIFLAANAGTAPVLAERRQEGCVRFSYLSRGARVPPRYHCQPESDDSLIRPQFTSTHYRDPAYCQLSVFCPSEIREGADDEASMGAFHDLYEPLREARLRNRLEEYLRFGLEAGIFYVT
jgi:hypothetical protein